MKKANFFKKKKHILLWVKGNFPHKVWLSLHPKQTLSEVRLRALVDFMSCRFGKHVQTSWERGHKVLKSASVLKSRNLNSAKSLRCLGSVIIYFIAKS